MVMLADSRTSTPSVAHTRQKWKRSSETVLKLKLVTEDMLRTCCYVKKCSNVSLNFVVSSQPSVTSDVRVSFACSHISSRVCGNTNIPQKQF